MEISQAEITDTGKPIWEARVDIAGCADVFEYYGGIAASIHGMNNFYSKKIIFKAVLMSKVVTL